MMTYDSGRKYTIAGFCVFTIIQLLGVIRPLLEVRIGIMLLAAVFTILNIIGTLSLILAAIGFLIMWRERHVQIDLFTAGSIGIAVVLSVISPFVQNNILRLAIGIIGGCYYLMLAMRARRFQPLLALVLALAYIYSLFSGALIALLMGVLGYTTTFVLYYLGFAACAAFCLAERLLERA